MKRNKPTAATPAFDADVIIVGAGMCGAVLAKELTAKNPQITVLVVEAGPKTSTTPEGYASYVRRFQGALAKIPNSPYPDSAFAPAPTVLQFQQIPKGTVSSSGYYVQQGPLPYGSEFDRTAGGTSMHWLGQTPRMLPNDLKLKSTYGVGVDWPFDYETLRPYYERAEFELGVSGDVSQQNYPGVDIAKYYGNYQFPMRALPRSYADAVSIPKVERARLKLPRKQYPHRLAVSGMPQARNSEPNPEYVNPETGQRGYSPVGAVDDPTRGLRCEGNSSCVPICPVQAKYNALKSLRAAQRTGRARVQSQTVAARVLFNRVNGRITGIECKGYGDFGTPTTSTTLRGRIYVLASNTIENAKLLINSGVPNTSGQLGRNLMDNVTMLRWGLWKTPLGVYRGPGSTTNISTFRDGPFRSRHAAFILPLDNWGWIWPAFGPDAQVSQLLGQGWPLQPPGAPPATPTIPPGRMFGRTLRECAGNAISRQFFIHYEMEQLPSESNRVTTNPGYTDALGIPRPVIQYNLSAYEMETFRMADRMSRELLPQLEVQDFTQYNPWDAGYFTYKGKGYTAFGAGHIVGTCRLGSHPRDSVLDPWLRAWEHPNLYVVGGAPMRTIGTGNPSITMVALTYRAADAILQDLAKLSA